MKTITTNALNHPGDEAPAGYAEMDVRMGALQLLDAQLRSHGLELEVADAGFGDFAKYVKVVKAEKEYDSFASLVADVFRGVR
jgi:hypothetical protein